MVKKCERISVNHSYEKTNLELDPDLRTYDGGSRLVSVDHLTHYCCSGHWPPHIFGNEEKTAIFCWADEESEIKQELEIKEGHLYRSQPWGKFPMHVVFADFHRQSKRLLSSADRRRRQRTTSVVQLRSRLSSPIFRKLVGDLGYLLFREDCGKAYD
ncbi:hypothetical protein L2E82_12405 [Cichorium intybus]|uniref:Uncharacterized protein n=1 Tax=Cichorium intybus TaxID=13427 RepID=A0ACB9GH74_CICIN|nr:hypothetical protein L2E82_12405 [Cichorium intybus]